MNAQVRGNGSGTETPSGQLWGDVLPDLFGDQSFCVIGEISPLVIRQRNLRGKYEGTCLILEESQQVAASSVDVDLELAEPGLPFVGLVAAVCRLQQPDRIKHAGLSTSVRACQDNCFSQVQ